MWHNKFVEWTILGLSIAIILIIGIITAIWYPESPTTFPYAVEYPESLVNSPVNTNAITLNADLLEVNKEWFTVYGI